MTPKYLVMDVEMGPTGQPSVPFSLVKGTACEVYDTRDEAYFEASQELSAGGNSPACRVIVLLRSKDDWWIDGLFGWLPFDALLQSYTFWRLLNDLLNAHKAYLGALIYGQPEEKQEG